jgi:hypothetical protein
MAYKKQIIEEGLDKSSTYCKADYNKLVGIVTEQIARVKSKCPLLFSVLLKNICARSLMLLFAHQIAISSIVRLSEKPTDDSIRVVVIVNLTPT